MTPTPRRTRVTRLSTAITIAIAVVTVLTACARPGGGSPQPSIGHPKGDELVIRVATDGGFMGPGMIFTRLPELTVLGNGRVILPGPVDAIYPGPALPNLQERRLSEPGLQALLRQLDATGLFGADHDYTAASRVVMDAPTTVFTLAASGRLVTVSIYALGLVDDPDRIPEISAEERSAYRVLAGLAHDLDLLNRQLPSSAWADAAWTPYTPTALRLLVTNVDGEAPPQGGLEVSLTPWPVSADPASYGTPYFSGGRCAVASGSAATSWLAALRTANALTRFTYGTHGEHRYVVQPRPLLPDEPASCPARG